MKRNLPHALSLPSLAHLIGFPLPPTRLSLAPGKCLMVGCFPLPHPPRGRLGLRAALPFTTLPMPQLPPPALGVTGVLCWVSEERSLTTGAGRARQAGSQRVSSPAFSWLLPESQLKPAHLLRGPACPLRVPGLCLLLLPLLHPRPSPAGPQLGQPSQMPLIVSSSPVQKQPHLSLRALPSQGPRRMTTAVLSTCGSPAAPGGPAAREFPRGQGHALHLPQVPLGVGFRETL